MTTHTLRIAPLAAGLVLAVATLGAGTTALAAAPGMISGWGYNQYGQLGNGTTVNSPTSVMFGPLSTATAVAAGDGHSLALLSDGTVMASGFNFSGQLGDGTTTEHQAPVAVSGLSRVTAIAAGNAHSLALLSNGTVVAWGANNSGQLGNGTTTDSHTPVAVPGLSGVTAIAAGANYSMALLSTGTVMAWGYNNSGQLGNGTTTDSHVPVAVSGLSDATAIAAGGAASDQSVALRGDGTVVAWGDNTFDQLGDGGTTSSSIPVKVSGLSGVVAIAAGGSHSLALLSNGNVMAWGYNFYGELGDGTTVDPSTPVAVSGLSGVAAISAGDNHSLALLANGTLMAWGDNQYGQLGDGTTARRLAPVAVDDVSGVVALAHGSTANHTLAVEGAFATVGPTLAFGSQLVGSSTSPQTVTLTNSGPAPLTVSGETLTGATSFDKTTDTCTGAMLAAGASCQIAVSFAPTEPGEATAAVAVNSSAANALSPVALSGTGVAPTSTTSTATPPLSITAVSQSHRTWRLGDKLAAIARTRRAPIGTTFRFALNEVATVHFAFTKRVAGRRVAKQCLRQTNRNRNKPTCHREMTAATLTLNGRLGTNMVSFQGRVSRTRKLEPGHYTLVITATNTNGERSRPQSLSFTIVSR